MSIPPPESLRLRTWVEYGFRQCKQELGWTDYRFTHFQHIERWWEIIFCVYTMISLNSPVFLSLNQSRQLETEVQENSDVDFSNHPQWEHPNLAKRGGEAKNIRDNSSRINGELYINTRIREN